jgi:hypothetical protein
MQTSAILHRKSWGGESFPDTPAINQQWNYCHREPPPSEPPPMTKNTNALYHNLNIFMSIFFIILLHDSPFPGSRRGPAASVAGTSDSFSTSGAIAVRTVSLAGKSGG